MGVRNVAARAVAALVVVALVGVAGWGSWRDRQARTEGGASGAPVGFARGVPAADAGAASGVDPNADPVRVPRGCWAQTGVATTPDAGVGTRISLRYCLEPGVGSTMTLSEGSRARCAAGVVPQPLGGRVRITMVEAPECEFGTPLPVFDALCTPPEEELMECDIDWGGGLVETFRLRRS